MAKPKTASAAERIAEIKSADAVARSERAALDQQTLTDLLVAAREAQAAVLRVESGCSDLVSDLTTSALKSQGSSMSERLASLIIVAEDDLQKVTTAIEAG